MTKTDRKNKIINKLEKVIDSKAVISGKVCVKKKKKILPNIFVINRSEKVSFRK